MEKNYNLINYIKSVVREAEKFGSKIIIDYLFPYIIVENNFEEYFLFGNEAKKLIESAKKSNLYPECSVEQIILWEAQSW